MRETRKAISNSSDIEMCLAVITLYAIIVEKY
jgi:hypothetical protein